MKQLSRTLVCLVMLLFALSANAQIKPANGQSGIENNKALYESGKIVVKLKSGYDFNVNMIQGAKNSGSRISSGIQSLDNTLNTNHLQNIGQPFANHKAAPIKPSQNKVEQKTYDLTRYYVLTFDASANTGKIIKELNSNPAVEYAEAKVIYTAFDSPDDPYYEDQFALSQINAKNAWESTHGDLADPQVIIGIDDSGVQWDHQDLVDNLNQNLGEDVDHDGQVIVYNDEKGKWEFDPDDINGIDDDGDGYVDDFIGWNFYTNDGTQSNDPMASLNNFHGTHVAGIAAGVTDNSEGIASIGWNVKFIPVKHGDNNGGSSLFNVEEGLVYLADMHVSIINCSWGSPVKSKYMQDMINYCYDNDALVVAAAGNTNNSQLDYPSAYKHVISVASVANNDKRASYSTYGIAPDISAPGGDIDVDGGILSTMPGNGYGRLQGTSMAAPLVSGLCALIKSKNSSFSVDDLAHQLLATADNVDGANPGMENSLGSGRINAFKAMDLSNPSFDAPLRLMVDKYSINDENGNGAIEPGETFTFNFSIRNFTQYNDFTGAKFTLECSSPDVTIEDSKFEGDIHSDDYSTFAGVTKVSISKEAKSEVISFNLKIETSGKAISWGANNDIEIVVNNGGALVYAPQTGEFGSAYIAGMCSKHSVPFIYSPVMPQSLSGFDAVFVSKGNIGTTGSANTLWTPEEVSAITSYLENGGKCFIEGGNLGDESVLPGLVNMAKLMGISSFNAESKSPVAELNGLDGSILNGLKIEGSNQTGYTDILDNIKVNPDEGGIAAFEEPGYGVVAVQNEGSFKQKGFYSSYSVGYLNNTGFPNTQEEVFTRVLKFFGYNLPVNLIYQGYSANDENNNKVIEPGENVSFNFNLVNTPGGVSTYNAHFTLSTDDKDITLVNPDFKGTITGDNINNLTDMFQIKINSDAKSHVAHFKLTISADDVDLTGSTEINFDMIITNGGVLVYEPMSGRDLSGEFIASVLKNQNAQVVYTNTLPTSLNGFDAAFISKGNHGTISSASAFWTAEELQIVSQYLADGGHCYVEGGAINDPSLESAYNVMNSLLGIESYKSESKDPIETLTGAVGSAAYKLDFNGSNQIGYESINDQLVPKADEGGFIAMTEGDFGAVAIQNEGSAGQRGFYFAYALSELNDNVYPVTREELLLRIAKFFGINNNLRLALNSYSYNDVDEDGAIESGETLSFNFDFKNITNQTEYQNALFTLETSNPDIKITNPSFKGDIAATDDISFEKVTELTISPNAQSQFADLTLKVTLPDEKGFVVGEFSIRIYIANGGVLVYEPETGNNLSGQYINDFFTRQNIKTVYTNKMPTSIIGMDAVYISMGNPGENMSNSAYWTAPEISAITDYLMDGGKCYIEGGAINDDNLKGDYTKMLALMGIDSWTNEDQASFTQIYGSKGSIINEIMFDATNQTDFMSVNNNLMVNKAENGMIAISETNAGGVAVQNEGSFGQKGFYFAYAISELTDSESGFPNTKEETMDRIARFFGFDIQREAKADFSIDYNTGNAPATVNFTDMSTGAAYITGWAWDINNDGTIESTDKNFAYTFDQPGSYDVKLTVTDGYQSWSIVKTDLIHIFEGETSYNGNNALSMATVPNLKDADLQKAFTFESWINPAGAGEIMDKGAVSFELLKDGSLELMVKNDDGTEAGYKTVSGVLTNNTWQHVAFTYSTSNGVHVIVNGMNKTLTTTGTLTEALAANDGMDFVIGNDEKTNNAFSGLIDEVRFWDVERTCQDIKFGKNDPRLVNANNLLGYWKFNGGRGEIVLDKTGNGNDIAMAADYGMGYKIRMELNLCDKNPCANNAVELGSYWVDKNGKTVFNTVVGGSDNYDYNWHPNNYLANAKSANPILAKASATMPFTLIAKDMVTGEQLTGTFNVIVKNAPEVHIPLILMLKKNIALDLMDQISDFNPAYSYQWQDDKGNKIDNPTNVLPNIGLTKYYVTAWNENGCPSATVRMTVFVSPLKEIAGDATIGNNGSIAVATYPNPVSDNLNIEAYFDSQTMTTVKLLDVTGREVYRSEYSVSGNFSTAIAVSNLASGTYTLVLSTDSDVVTQNIVVVR